MRAAQGFDKLGKSYLFSEVRARKDAFLRENGGSLIDLGVGDVAFPLPPSSVAAIVAAAEEMGDNVRFRGYPPEGGYDFLRQSIAEAYADAGAKVSGGEVFVGDGAKSDASAFTTLFEPCEVVIPEPVYPVYLDSALLCGHRPLLLSGSKQNGFLPTPAALKGKEGLVIWLCSPNNPTGAAYDGDGLAEWVRFALDTGSLILFDAAYAAFAGDGMPKTIYSVDGARGCAVEFGSFSKFAGFTGMRCSWTVVPHEIMLEKRRLQALWQRRQAAEFNGVSYVVQRAAQAALSPQGRRECRVVIDTYKRNSCVLGHIFQKHGVWHTGCEHSPYLWFECLRGDSWTFFDRLMRACRVVGTPGVGFGPSGEGFFRLSCFTTPEIAREAAARLDSALPSCM